MNASKRHLRFCSDIGHLKAAWRQIQGQGGVSHPMYSWEWMSTWLEVFGDDCCLLAFILEENGKPQAIVPMVGRKTTTNKVFSFNRLTIIGTGEPQKQEVFTEYADFPALQGDNACMAASLAEAVSHLEGEFGWDDIVLYRIRPGSFARLFSEELGQKQGYRAAQTDSGVCYYIELPETMEDYMYELSKKRRYQTRRSIRDLNDLGELTSRKAHTVEEALSILDDLRKLHQQRWQNKGEPGACASEPFMRFHRRFINRTFDLGWPYLWALELDGRPIACRYNIRYNNNVACYLSGMTLLENNRIQPGIVVHYYAIKDAIESGAREYDFLVGAQSYKESLSNASRKLVTIRVSKNNFKERLRRLAVPTAKKARKPFRWLADKWQS